jgi:hypothetical protein
MPTNRNGQFTFTINSKELARGLRPSKRVPRDSKFLVNCEGAVGLDEVLQVLADYSLNQVDVSDIANVAFPFPQLFIFTNLIVVASLTKIYEFDGTTLTEVLTISSGSLWQAADFISYIYMSNGITAIKRDAFSGIWSVDSVLPIANAIVNNNSQVLIASPTES